MLTGSLFLRVFAANDVLHWHMVLIFKTSNLQPSCNFLLKVSNINNIFKKFKNVKMYI